MTPDPVSSAAQSPEIHDGRSEVAFVELGTGTFVRAPGSALPAAARSGEGTITLNFENTALS